MFRLKKIKVSEQTDEKLMIGIVNGHSDAFNELYKRYHKRLLYYFYRMLGNNQQVAQDFLQDIFYKIIEKPQLFNPRKKFSTWIFSIAHNMCKNEYRSREVRKIIVNDETADGCAEITNEKNEQEFLIKAIFGELESFDESHRTAFLLKYREGFSIDEISNTLDLAKGTIKSRLFYTRKKLQEVMTGKYAEMIEDLF